MAILFSGKNTIKNKGKKTVTLQTLNGVNICECKCGFKWFAGPLMNTECRECKNNSDDKS